MPEKLGTKPFKPHYLGSVGVNMSKSTLSLKPCTVTMGQPFNTSRNRMCPVYEKMKIVLEARGWNQKAFHASKIPQGDMCYFKYDGIEKVQEEGGDVGILFSLDVNIEGLNKSSGNTCMVNMTLESFEPDKKLNPINHTLENNLLSYFEETIKGPIHR